MSLKTKIKESNKIIDSIEDVAAEVKKSSDDLKDFAIDKTIVLNSSKTPYTASSLVAKAVDAELKSVIKDVNSSFSDFVEATQRYLSDNYTINLTKKDLEAISKKGSQITEDLVSNTAILKKDIQGILTQNLAKGMPTNRLVKELKDLYPAYASNAATIINTGNARLFNDINVTKFQESDFGWYLWAGPNDKVTREIPCKHWVWHKFPASKLSTITATRMRLWNCRHSIIPISEEEAKDYPEGSLSYA